MKTITLRSCHNSVQVASPRQSTRHRIFCGAQPANDGRRPHVDHRIAPIEESGEQCEADASRVIHASGFDPTLDITRELFAKNQVLSADRAGRAQERDDQPQDVRGYSDDCSRQLQHVLIMPESARVCRCRTPKCPRRELLRITVITMPNLVLNPATDRPPTPTAPEFVVSKTRKD